MKSVECWCATDGLALSSRSSCKVRMPASRAASSSSATSDKKSTSSPGRPMASRMAPASDPVIDPAPRGYGVTSYAGNAGWDRHRRLAIDSRLAGVFPFYDGVRISNIVDGTSNTIFIGEVRSFCSGHVMAGWSASNAGVGLTES